MADIYAKVDDATFKQTKTVEIKYDVEQIKQEIQMLKDQITRIQAEQTAKEALLAEAVKLGITTE